MKNTVKLSTIVTGHRFRFEGVLFSASHETRTESRRKHRRVIYRESAGHGLYQPGDATWLPVGESVEPAPFAGGSL